jgi:hypothetical protein
VLTRGAAREAADKASKIGTFSRNHFPASVADAITHPRVDPETFGRELGVIREWEAVE